MLFTFLSPTILENNVTCCRKQGCTQNTVVQGDFILRRYAISFYNHPINIVYFEFKGFSYDFKICLTWELIIVWWRFHGGPIFHAHFNPPSLFFFWPTTLLFCFTNNLLWINTCNLN